MAVMLGLMSLTINRLVRRKLRLSLLLLTGYLAGELIYVFYGSHLSPQTVLELTAFVRLALAAALINAAVFVLFNPLRIDRVPDRFPAILQDAIVIALILLAATFLSQQLLTTSAVSAVVLGFALQDTLGNAFAGLAIQSEKPFHVGHWIKVGEYEGRVAEVTWRATKLRTKAGNFVIVPNNVVGKEAITNYSQPTIETRTQVEVGASYAAPPNQVKAAIMEAMRRSSRVLAAPAPDVQLQSFDGSSIVYSARFWINDFETDGNARDEVRTAIYYTFQRRGIEIPYPIQVQYERSWRDPDINERVQQEERLLASIDLFKSLSPELRRQIALASPMAVFGSGETVVRQGEAGQSMFVIVSGSVRVVLNSPAHEVARIGQGGYFGEMSLLTGDPRSATVLAVEDTVVVEISADLFRRIASLHPEAIEQIAEAAGRRGEGLEQARTSAGYAAGEAQSKLLARIKKFLFS